MSKSKVNIHRNEIADYYFQCNNAYRDAWGLDQNMQLNLGLWKKGTKNLKEALYHLNEEIAQYAQLQKGDIVLDAGCGVGGTAIHLAKKYACSVTGITLATNQLKQAKENAKKEGVNELCNFQLMDYSSTDFADESFDVIIGIESICYAEPKSAFLKEAHRLLKKGGRLVLAENLQAKNKLNQEEYDCLYTNAFNGCKVKSLDTKGNYLKNLNDLNFSFAHCFDYTEFIRPSIKRLRRFYYPAHLYNRWHRFIGKPFSATQEANTKMCYYLLSSLNRGLWKYGIIKAVK